MRITGWRLVVGRWRESAFSGDGARVTGGRWNSKGTSVVYLSGSLALAALELLTHLDHQQALAQHYAIPVVFGESLIAVVHERSVPTGFPGPETIPATQRVGDAWVRSGTSSLLRVPSAVISQEFNYLFNPAHPDAQSVAIGDAKPFSYDRRLLEGGGAEV
ncbi:MAG: RES family NAD+ phosphorylase [Trueperaceae bacterium]